MMTEINERDLISMKLLHFLITKKNYSPIIVQGVENEIWLENLDEEYKVIRIVNNYIHNDEQLNFDVFKTKRMVKKIKRKTFSWHIKVLNILTDVGDNVNRETPFDNVDIVFIKEEKELKENKLLNEKFPDLSKNMEYTEDGFQLFLKITEEINSKNRRESMEAERVIEPKKIILNYIVLGIILVVFLATMLDKNDFILNNFCVFKFFIQKGQVYRLLTGAFIHIDPIHLLSNGYALYVIGNMVENYYGKKKYPIILIVSAITASLLSITMSDTPSIGISGVIFGFLGSLIYFGYNYRVYFGSVLISKIVPVIIFNLFIGFMISGIDNFAHIGGLIGGFLISMALGVNSKHKTRDKVNGYILTFIFIAFLVYLGIFR